MHRDGVPEGDKKRLYQHARLALHEMDAIDNLKHLGVNVDKVRSPPSSSRLARARTGTDAVVVVTTQDSGKKRKALFKQREEDDSYDISRYQPQLRYMLEEHFAGKLDHSVFPYVRDAPVGSSSTLSRSSASPAANAPPSTGSLRSARPQWTSQRAKRVVDAPKQRVLVFVAGGATFSEVRSVYKLSEAAQKDIFLGTTHLVTPQQFVADLSSLERGGSSHTDKGFAPNKGKPFPPRAPGIPQEALDRRYYVKVAAPPPPVAAAPSQAAPEASRRPSSIASSLTGRAPSSQGLTPTASASSAPTSANGSPSSSGASASKIKKKGFLRKLI